MSGYNSPHLHVVRQCKIQQLLLQLFRMDAVAHAHSRLEEGCCHGHGPHHAAA